LSVFTDLPPVSSTIPTPIRMTSGTPIISGQRSRWPTVRSRRLFAAPTSASAMAS
jgi:hypothetical protein